MQTVGLTLLSTAASISEAVSIIGSVEALVNKEASVCEQGSECMCENMGTVFTINNWVSFVVIQSFDLQSQRLRSLYKITLDLLFRLMFFLCLQWKRHPDLRRVCSCSSDRSQINLTFLDRAVWKKGHFSVTVFGSYMVCQKSVSHCLLWGHWKAECVAVSAVFW